MTIEEAIHVIQSNRPTSGYTMLCEALDIAVAALREQEERRWIPVTESPKGNGCYIVAVNHWVDGKPVTREAYWNGCDWLSCDKKRELTPRVTHWMPMPEPPKEA